MLHGGDRAGNIGVKEVGTLQEGVGLEGKREDRKWDSQGSESQEKL